MRKVLVGLMCLVFLFSAFASTAHARNLPVNSNDEMRQQIDELRALINMLITLMGNNNSETAQNQPNMSGIPSISSQRARDIAVELVGHGTARDVFLISENSILTFEVEIRYNAVRYMVYVNAINGSVIRMSRHEDVTPSPSPSPSPAPTASPSPSPSPPASGGNWSHVVPRSPGRSGGPSNPPISAQRAVELAHAHIVALGITDYRFDYVYMDMERRTWVWSVEFDSRRRGDLEFYVDVNTGEFLKAPR